MNPRPASHAAHVAPDVAEARLGLRITSLLSEVADNLSHDVEERLRFARKQALDQRLRVRTTAPALAEDGIGFGNSLVLFGGQGSRWQRWFSVLPLLALVGGLFLIQYELGQKQIEAAADIDAALLGDDLPPAAYRDAGFVEYLKAPRN